MLDVDCWIPLSLKLCCFIADFRLGRVEMDLIRSIRDQEQCQSDMKEHEAQKIEMEEEFRETLERYVCVVCKFVKCAPCR